VDLEVLTGDAVAYSVMLTAGTTLKMHHYEAWTSFLVETAEALLAHR
jgi:hypothetical protein